MLFVATREVVLVVHTTHFTAHTQSGTVSRSITAHYIKNTSIRSFKKYVKLINRIMNFSVNLGIREIFSGNL